MNEIVIEDKKYISSKRAAEITGYAKDYVGQLCREGRIQARLIGRNWYVLEAAIQDHRFRAEEPVAEVEKKEEDKQIRRFSQETWEAPRYEPVEAEELPVVDAPKRPFIASEEEPKPVTDMHEAWKAWFSAPNDPPEVAETSIPVESSEREEEKETAAEPEVTPEEIPQEQEEAVVINYIHAPPLIRREEPIELPVFESEDAEEEQEASLIEERVKVRSYILPRLAAGLVALIALILLAVNSGYLDSKIGSYNQASVITGISTYRK